MKITKQQLKQIIKEELEKLHEIPTWRKLQPEAHPGQHPGPLKGETEKEEAWVLRKSGASDASSFLQPAPASDQKKGNYKWGAKEGARTFKGENGKARAADEQKKLKKNGITVSVEKK